MRELSVKEVEIKATNIPFPFKEDSEIKSENKTQLFLDIPSSQSIFKPDKRIEKKLLRFLKGSKGQKLISKAFEGHSLKGAYNCHLLVAKSGITLEELINELPEDIKEFVDLSFCYSIGEYPQSLIIS